MTHLTSDLVDSYARVALANITLEYPHHLSHLMRRPTDLVEPRRLHPAFYGSYDWHSSVHMHWLLIRLLRENEALRRSQAIVDTLDRHLTPEHLEVERAYFRAPGRGTFERPYGWAWLLKLAAEARIGATTIDNAAAWSRALAPFADDIAHRFENYLPQATYPVRAGTHGNTAFAMVLALDWADGSSGQTLRDAITQRALSWFGNDRKYPGRFEPSGDDFLSGGLTEAMLMQRVLSAPDFVTWWSGFRPEPAEWARWMQPVVVADRSDAKTTHLDGLNLSRAWALRSLARTLTDDAAQLREAAHAHLEASLTHAVEGDYVGTHWLATFATLALST